MKLYLDLLLHQFLLLLDVFSHLLVNMPLGLLLQVLFVFDQGYAIGVVSLTLVIQHFGYSRLIVEFLGLLVYVRLKGIFIEIVLEILRHYVVFILFFYLLNLEQDRVRLVHLLGVLVRRGVESIQLDVLLLLSLLKLSF